MKKVWFGLSGLLLLALLYVLVQLAYIALGAGYDPIETNRLFLAVALLAGVSVASLAFSGLKTPGPRLLVGAVIGLVATVLIPVWSYTGDWWSDQVTGLVVGAASMIAGAAAARFGAAPIRRLAAIRSYLPSAATAALLVCFIGGAALTLPPWPHEQLTVYGKNGPLLAFRRVESDSILAELRPKPWASEGVYGGPVSIGANRIVQTLSNLSLRCYDLGGQPIATPSIAPSHDARDSWYPPQAAGDLMLLRRSLEPWPTLASMSEARVLTPAGATDQQFRAAVITETGAYTVDWEGIEAWDANGVVTWTYRRQPVQTPDMHFRTDLTLNWHPANSGWTWDAACLSLTPDGPVAGLRSEVAALTADGRLRWRVTSDGEVLASTASADGALVLTLEMVPLEGGSGAAAGVVRAFDGRTGAPLWQWDVPDDVVSLNWATNGSSALLSLDRQGGETTNNEFLAFSRWGDVTWQCVKDRDEYGALITRLAPLAEGYLVTGSWEATLLGGADGQPRWTVAADRSAPQPAAFDYRSGQLLWQNSLVLVKGRRVAAYDLATGGVLWEYREPYGITGVSAAGDYLAIGSSRGVTLLQWAGECPT